MEDFWATIGKTRAPVELDADSRIVGQHLFNLRKSLMDAGFSKREAQKMVHDAYVQVITISMVGGVIEVEDDDGDE